MIDPINAPHFRRAASDASHAAQAETKRHNEAAAQRQRQRQREAAAMGAELDPDSIEQGEPA